MSKIDDGGYAFPRAATETNNPNMFFEPQEGMTLRDYFAAAAMQSLAPNVFADAQKYGRDPQKALIQLVDGSFAIADAMLAARKEGA
jgi:hypothetical protein